MEENNQKNLGNFEYNYFVERDNLKQVTPLEIENQYRD